MKYEHHQIKLFAVILVKTMLSLNHCRMHGKRAKRYCVPMLRLWIISHIEMLRNIFNNFWWFGLQPLKIIIDETWKNLDEKAWVRKYTTK